MVTKNGDKWEVHSGGRVIGRHDTLEGAQRQEWALEAVKRARGWHPDSAWGPWKRRPE